MKTLLRLSKLIAPLFPVMVLAVILGTLGHFCAIGIPFFGILSVFEKFPVKFLLLVGLMRGVLHYAEQYCNHFIAFTLLARIRSIVFSKLRTLGPAKLDGKQKGNILTVLTSDIELLEVFYAHTISPVCIAVLVCLTVSAVLFKIHFILGIIAAAFYVITGILIPAVISPFAQKAAVEHRKEFASMNSFLLDCLRGLEMTILYGTGLKKLKDIEIKSDELSESKYKLAENEGATSLLSGLCVSLAGLTMLAVSLVLFKKNFISFEQVMISVVLILSSFGPVIAVANLGSGLSQTIACGKRLLALLDEKPALEEITDKNEIEFSKAQAENLFFSYDKKTEILSDINVLFEKGKITGIQGKSGSGKSTLLKLFMRFWKADSGQIKISDTSVENINTACLRKIEGLVSQETVLFHDTIENNIKIAKPDASSEEVQEACKKAQIHDFIMELPSGYKTQVMELGDNFSGGERQRLGLARAFLHNADFLLLDEPTSNLDSWNEKQIMNAIKENLGEKTVVIVSHRDSTFEHADKIYKIETGRNC